MTIPRPQPTSALPQSPLTVQRSDSGSRAWATSLAARSADLSSASSSSDEEVDTDVEPDDVDDLAAVQALDETEGYSGWRYGSDPVLDRTPLRIALYRSAKTDTYRQKLDTVCEVGAISCTVGEVLRARGGELTRSVRLTFDKDKRWAGTVTVSFQTCRQVRVSDSGRHSYAAFIARTSEAPAAGMGGSDIDFSGATSTAWARGVTTALAETQRTAAAATAAAAAASAAASSAAAAARQGAEKRRRSGEGSLDQRRSAGEEREVRLVAAADSDVIFRAAAAANAADVENRAPQAQAEASVFAKQPTRASTGRVHRSSAASSIDAKGGAAAGAVASSAAAAVAARRMSTRASLMAASSASAYASAATPTVTSTSTSSIMSDAFFPPVGADLNRTSSGCSVTAEVVSSFAAPAHDSNDRAASGSQQGQQQLPPLPGVSSRRASATRASLMLLALPGASAAAAPAAAAAAAAGGLSVNLSASAQGGPLGFGDGLLSPRWPGAGDDGEVDGLFGDRDSTGAGDSVTDDLAADAGAPSAVRRSHIELS